MFNIQDYICECVDSVLDIPELSYEVLIINDGSTDLSLEKVEKYNSIGNVTIISQQNAGLSGARNTGLKHAQGDYVLFLDGDDFIDGSQLRKLLEHQHRSYDIISGNYYEQFNDYCIWNVSHNIITEECISGSEVVEKYYIKTLSSVVWRNIYKRTFLIDNNLFFTEGIYHEDLEWMPRVYLMAQNVRLTKFRFYYYRQREGSIVHSNFNHKKMADRLFIAEKLLKYSFDLSYGVRKQFALSAFHTMLIGLKECRGCLTYEEREKIKKISKAMPMTKPSYDILGIMCRFFPVGVSLLINSITKTCY